MKGWNFSMYSICVAEDEAFEREYLCEYLKKNFSDSFIVYSAESGEEALEIIRDKKVNILITDIKMGELSGIDLAEIVYKNYSDTTVIIMSAYEEFDYAKKAISCHVREYFVKPVRLSVLGELVSKILGELNRKNAINDFSYDEMLFEKREYFFFNLIYGSEVNLKEKLAEKDDLFFSFDIESTPCDLISLKITDYEKFIVNMWEYPKDTLKMVMNNLISGFLKSSKMFYIRENAGIFDYIIYHNEGTVIDYEYLGEKISYISKVPIQLICKKKNIPNIYDLVDFCNRNADIYEKTLLLITYVKENNRLAATELLFNLMKRKDKNEIIKCIFSEISAKPCDEDYKLDGSEIYERIAGILDSDRDIGAEIVRKAKEYVKTNYSKNISREDVARAVNFSPSYLSKNFKELTGESVSDYILKVRMKKAIELMKENKYKAYEIAEKVGYSNTKYFFPVFKMYTGYTPKEYMTKIGIFGKEKSKENENNQ